MKTVVIFNHKKEQCGVYQYGYNVYSILKNSKKYNIWHKKVGSELECRKTVESNPIDGIIYNYHRAPVPWLKGPIEYHKPVKQLQLINEVILPKFDAYIHTDKNITEKDNNFVVGRPLPPYSNKLSKPTIPTIGSYGFGGKRKGYSKIISIVEKEFDEAIIRLHIPCNNITDPLGHKAKARFKECTSLISKPNISLEINSKFLTNEQLLDWVAQNTINVFFYDSLKGCGIASAPDISIATKTPIAITNSYMFRNLLSIKPSICIQNNSLQNIINNGFTPLEDLYEECKSSNYIRKFEDILDHVFK